MMKAKQSIFLLVVPMVLLSMIGCATIPSGPSVMALPAPGKSFEQFQMDDYVCRQWAAQRIGQSPQETADQSAVKSAAVGTVVGAALGAVIGAAAGHAGTGAAIGAGSGLVVGTAAGANAGEASGWRAQHIYDMAYTQCMYAKGNQVPGVTQTRRYRRPPPPPPPPDFNSGPPAE